MADTQDKKEVDSQTPEHQDKQKADNQTTEHQDKQLVDNLLVLGSLGQEGRNLVGIEIVGKEDQADESLDTCLLLFTRCLR